MAGYLLVLVIGVVAGLVSGLIGTGASIILLPVLAWYFGPQSAVPIMAVAAVLGNLSRIALWWKDIDWRGFLAYSAGSVPCAALGAKTLLVLSPGTVDVALGLFFLGMIPYRHWAASRQFVITRWWLGLAGCLVGYLTGIVLSTGPLTIPVFAAYGLIGGPLLATDGAAAFVTYVSKVVAFAGMGALPPSLIAKGALIGLSLSLGMLMSKVIALKIAVSTYQRLLNVLLLGSGLALLLNAMS